MANLNDKEKEYVQITKYKILSDKNCEKLRTEYIYNCEKSEILSKIREFYDDNWYNNLSENIDSLISLQQTRDALLKIKDFKLIYKLNINIKTIEDDVSDIVDKCISKRIQYKYGCVKEKNRDKGHDAEILRNIFYKEKYIQLKELIFRIKNKHLELKKKINKEFDEERRLQIEERRIQDEERRRQDEEMLNVKMNIEKYDNEFAEIELYLSSSSNDFKPGEKVTNIILASAYAEVEHLHGRLC
jgi:hypothetical protein